ncbi:MAG: hypothetical protein ACPHT8_12040 [Limisphaerales bacterium]
MDLDADWIVTLCSASIGVLLRCSWGHHPAGIQPFLTLLRDLPGRQLLRAAEMFLSD